MAGAVEGSNSKCQTGGCSMEPEIRRQIHNVERGGACSSFSSVDLLWRDVRKGRITRCRQRVQAGKLLGTGGRFHRPAGWNPR